MHSSSIEEKNRSFFEKLNVYFTSLSHIFHVLNPLIWQIILGKSNSVPPDFKKKKKEI